MTTKPGIAISLQTVNGDLVAEGLIIPFGTYPDVIVWGLRVFQLKSNDGERLGPIPYRECFVVHVPTASAPGEYGIQANG